jgi:Fanconi anemia group M protein
LFVPPERSTSVGVEQSLRILVDHREFSSGVPDLLGRHAATLVVPARLAAGDYAIDRTLGIERKTAADFAKSLIDGRLFAQASALRRRYRRGVLLLEGSIDRETAGVSPEALRGGLVSIAVVFGVAVLYSSGPEETAELIVRSARQIEHGVRPGDCYVRPGYRPKGWRRRALYVLQGLPNVGPRRAAALLAAFGSAGAALGATEPELRAVPEIGAGVARGIRLSLGPEATGETPGLDDPYGITYDRPR